MSGGLFRRRQQARPHTPTTLPITNPFDPAGANTPGTQAYTWPSTPSTVRIVSLSGSAGSDASRTTNPIYTSIGAAMTAAASSDTIVIKAGTYRAESAVFIASKTLTIQNAPNETVWVDGSYQVSTAGGDQNMNPSQFGGTTAAWTNSGESNTNIYRKTGIVQSFSHANANDATDPAFPAGPYPENVLYATTGGATPIPMTQVLSKAGLTTQGQFFYDQAASTLYIFGNPANWDVFVSKLQWAWDLPGRTVMRGFGIRRYATSPNQFGTVRCTGANSLFEHMVFEDTSYEGLFFHAGSGTTVRHCDFTRNGKAGLTADQADNLTVEYSTFVNNNYSRFRTDTEAGGFKVTNSTGVTVRGNIIDDNWGHGMWLDIACEFITVYRNRSRRNQANGLYHEISTGSTFVGNICHDNGAHGIGLGTAGAAEIWNNTLINNRNAQLYYESGNRTDSVAPSHIPVGCHVVNNIFSGHTQSTNYLQTVFDWLNVRVWWVDSTTFSTSGLTGEVGMRWSSDYNAYYRESTSVTPGLAVLPNAGSADINGNTLANLQSGTAAHGTQDVHSIQASGGASDAMVSVSELSSWTGLGPMRGQTVIDPNSSFAPIGPALSTKGTTISTTYRDQLGITSAVTPEMGAMQV